MVRRVHSTKLKDKILSYFQDMEAHKKGRDVMLIFNSDLFVLPGPPRDSKKGDV